MFRCAVQEFLHAAGGRIKPERRMRSWGCTHWEQAIDQCAVIQYTVMGVDNVERRDKYRTQLYLDEARYLFLKESAAKHNTSMAEVVRALIDKEMGGADAITEGDPLFRIAATAVTTGRRDGSTDHDRYIYGSRPSGPDRPGMTVEDGGAPR